MTPSRTAFCLAIVTSLLACEEKKAAPSTSASAEAPGAAVDPNLAQAVAAVNSAAPATAPKPEDGPPETGVFGPGDADKLHAKGAAPKISIGSNGNAPRSTLTLDLKPGWKQKASIVLSMRAARQMLPPISFDVAMEAQKQKEGTPGTPVLAKVNAATVGEIEGQAIPPELQQQVGKLKGSKVMLQVLESGAIADARYELPKGGDPNLNTVLRSLAESISVSSVVYPSEPVGAGAFWLVTSRDFAAGADVISYRMIKLDGLNNGSGMTLSISTKRYSTTNKLTLAGLPPGDLTLVQFQSESTGKASGIAGQLFPSEGDQTQVLNAVLVPAENQQQRMAVQSQATAQIKLAAE